MTGPVEPSAAQPSSTPASAAGFGALAHRDFRRYFVTGLISMMADNIEHVISYWIIFQAFHSPALAGFAVISHWVPFLLLSVWAGALADRFDCRKLIQVSQALYMLCSLAWGLLYLSGTLRLWHAVAILLVHGLAGVLTAPASQLIVHDVVGGQLLASGIRLAASSRQLGILLGPAVGGGLMLLLTPGWGLLANVLLFLPMTVLLAIFPYTGHRRDGGSRRATGIGLGELVGLLGDVRADRRIFTMILLGGITSLFVGNAFQAQMPEYAHHLGTDDAGLHYSLLLAANAVGAVAGGFLLEAVRLFAPTARAAIVCAAIWAGLMGIFPAAPNYPVAVTILVLAGIVNMAFTTMAQTLVQLLAPPGLRGRIVGLFNTASLGLRAGSGLTVGVLGAVIDVRWSLALSSAVVFLISLVLLTSDLSATRARASE